MANVLRILVFTNGDDKKPSQPFTTTRRGLDLDGLCDRMTARFNPTFGAVRRVYSTGGKRIHNIDDIENDMSYVIAGNHGFKRINYDEIKLMTKREATHASTSPQRSKTTVSRYQTTTARATAAVPQALSIMVVRNGDEHGAAARVLLQPSYSWQQVLDAVNRKVPLSNSAVRKLYTIDGSSPQTMDELVHKGLYVAAGREPLKKVSYQAWKAAQEAPNSPTKRAATQLSMTSPPRNGLAAGSKTTGSPAKTTGSSPRTKGPAGKISSGGKFDKVEKEFSSLLGPGQAKKLKAMWKRIDYNGNNIVSLAEIDKFIVEQYPVLNSKPALMRAYKKSTLKDQGDGDAWVETFEFPSLLRNILYFNKAFDAFDDVDTDDDRRMDFGEFMHGLSRLGLDLSPGEARAEFNAIDKNGGGVVLFDEFCIWLAERQCPVDGQIEAEFTTSDSRPGPGGPGNDKAKAKGKAKGKGKARDDKPDIDTTKFDKVEAEITQLVRSPGGLDDIWKQLDYNGNNIVSLAEIDKLVSERFPVLDHKPALMRAYKHATLRGAGDGDAWVEKHELKGLLRNLFYFNRLWAAFDDIDTDDDRRIDLGEFKKGLSFVGLELPAAEAEAEFNAMDANGGGVVLFDEFAAWAAKKKCPVDGDVESEYTTSDSRPTH